VSRIDIDTSDWGPFNPNDPHDAMCERERLAFTQYVFKRVKKMPRTGSDEASIWIGGIMSIVEIIYAMHDNAPPDAARESLHKVFDFAWLQCAGMAMDKESLS